jgi:hypothetical protein
MAIYRTFHELVASSLYHESYLWRDLLLINLNTRLMENVVSLIILTYIESYLGNEWASTA